MVAGSESQREAEVMTDTHTEHPLRHYDRTCPACNQQFRFNGADYVHARDSARLSGQILRVWNVMLDGRWRTLGQIASLTRDPEPSISAQLRHLRKPRFGEHRVERRHKGNGLYEYRLIASGMPQDNATAK